MEQAPHERRLGILGPAWTRHGRWCVGILKFGIITEIDA